MSKESGAARAERLRAAATTEWTGLTDAIRGETGFDPRSWAWFVGLAGLAIGFELGRRGRQWLDGARESGAGTDRLSRQPRA